MHLPNGLLSSILVRSLGLLAEAIEADDVVIPRCSAGWLLGLALRACHRDERGLWARSRLLLFGHALLEKLVSPYKSITAHVFTEAVPEELGEDLAGWDAWLVSRLDSAAMARKPFTPLPVLGVPGWCADNHDAGFYADTAVFRPARRS